LTIPEHIAVIMDGNGRWAKKRNLPRAIGHRKGVGRVKEILREAKKVGVKVLTVFAFSTENWNRPKQEINFIFSYLVRFLADYEEELIENNIQFKAIGRRDRLSKEALKSIERVEMMTRENKSFIFNVALDYGGRWDILNAAKQVTEDVMNKKIQKNAIDEDIFKRYTALGGVCDPDLLIRTSGEQRISNFLLWDLAYSECYFTPVLWPDFKKKDLLAAIESYSNRKRKFGRIDA